MIWRQRRGRYIVEVYQRADDRWAWRLRAPNGELQCTDGGQGFRDKRDATRAAEAARRGMRQATIRVVP